MFDFVFLNFASMGSLTCFLVKNFHIDGGEDGGNGEDSRLGGVDSRIDRA
ncbi:hypothetical protein LINPERHAP1_LOCUS33087 [Linum perenne]